ncbi:MAG: histidine phosphatase family protein [Propioniciclava sp.]|nr:histidine phosphatase family protein [Propioniciclava sp.]
MLSAAGSGEATLPQPRSLVIVRHGRTVANARGLLLGRADPPLDEVGEAQAAALAAAVASGRFGSVAAVVSSPLVRAQQTAGHVAAKLGLEVQTDERLIEIDYGEFEGTPVTDVPAATWRQWQEDLHFRPPEGESLAELGRRVRECCEDWSVREPAGGAVVLVSHVSPIKAAVAWALGVDEAISWRAHLDTASITRVLMRGDRPVLSLYNDTSHVDTTRVT